MSWMKWLGFTVAVLVVLAIGAAAYGSSRWGEGTRALLARLEAARMPPSPPRYEARELDGLPAPVQRYFRAVLKDGQPIIAAIGLGDQRPDLVVRFGRGPTLPSSLRRPVQAVLV